MSSFDIEDLYNNSLILGIDEAGRGPLAGPLVVAGVIVDRRIVFEGVKDSKQLTIKQRESLYRSITKYYKYSVVVVPVYRIDEVNILQATIEACKDVASKLANDALYLVDGNMKFSDARFLSIVKGDEKSYSIAAASIVAKVTRDRIMQELHKDYPLYCWNSNSGYGSKQHIEAIKLYGLSEHHRRSFKPKCLRSA